MSIRTLVEKLVAHPFVKLAAVTDHNNIEGAEVARRIAAQYSDILIIPGVEITTTKGDIVILGAERLPPKPWTVERVIDFAKETACVSVAVHPFREWGLGENARDSGVDTIEILNGGSSFSSNKQAHNLAKELGLPGIAGSDSHKPSDLFCVNTEVRASLEMDEILTAVKAGFVSASVTPKSIHF